MGMTDGLTPSLAEAARVEWFTANIPSSRPIYRSKDWTEVVREADPDPPAYVKYRFSDGREFK